MPPYLTYFFNSSQMEMHIKVLSKQRHWSFVIPINCEKKREKLEENRHNDIRRNKREIKARRYHESSIWFEEVSLHISNLTCHVLPALKDVIDRTKHYCDAAAWKLEIRCWFQHIGKSIWEPQCTAVSKNIKVQFQVSSCVKIRGARKYFCFIISCIATVTRAKDCIGLKRLVLDCSSLRMK